MYATTLFAFSELEGIKERYKIHNINVYHHYVNKFSVDGTEYFIRFTVTENKVSRKNKGAFGENFVHSTAVSNVENYKNASSSNDTGLLTRAEEKDTFTK